MVNISKENCPKNAYNIYEAVKSKKIYSRYKHSFCWKTRYCKESGDFMKTTGVVRRIDDLGRIVVPKEIRRSLRIRDGESLEIFVDKDMIALKKYSPMNDMEDISQALADAVYQSLNASVIITDRDEVLGCSLPLRKKYLGRSLSRTLEENIVDKKELNSHLKTKFEISDGLFEEGYFYGSTILVNGDAVGKVILYEPEKNITDTEKHMVTIITQFLSKHLEQ